eukprot:TRINITY_DN25750_c0_g1_i1.p1 TRINITY_DN25750_c0_g1~~TRINITY_DN25750_c0_g1_i1.p1  ORF type:complete len:129 (+),score=39.48 TRINITY_DN25750_c0_g1_i1:24-389(+)
MAGKMKKRDILHGRNIEHSALVVQAGSFILGKPAAFDACQRILFYWDFPTVLIQGPDIVSKLASPFLTPYLNHPCDHDSSNIMTVIQAFVSAVIALRADLLAIDGGEDLAFLERLRTRFPN